MSAYIYPIAFASPLLISLARAKEHLKVETSDEDDYINDLVQAAISAAENYTGISINQAKFEVKSSVFIDALEFKVSPISSLTKIEYLQLSDNAVTLLAAENYEFLPVDKYVHKVCYPNFSDLPAVKENDSSAVIISVITGYDATTLPKGIMQAILLILGDLYENRQDRADKLPKRSESLLRRYRLY